jgi:hypothetical protein
MARSTSSRAARQAGQTAASTPATAFFVQNEIFVNLVKEFQIMDSNFLQNE